MSTPSLQSDAMTFTPSSGTENTAEKSAKKRARFSFNRGAPLREIAMIFKFLGTLIQAGLPLTRALSFSSMQAKNVTLKHAIEVVLEDIRSGSHFSESIGKFPHLFSPLMVQMLVVGENSGDLSGMLFKIHHFLEDRLEKRGNILSALAYPMLLVIACIGVVVFMLTNAVPKLASIFDGLGAELPPITKACLASGNFLSSYGIFIVAGLVMLGILMNLWVATDSGKTSWNKIKLHIPFFGSLLEKTAAAQFASTLAILVSGGVPMLRSLEITASAIDNIHIRRRLEAVRNEVAIGNTLHDALKKDATFNEVVCAMVAIGEESGELDKMLMHINDIYEQEIKLAMNMFTKLIEPVLILAMTGIVGLIAASIMVPLADLSSAIK